MGAHHGLSPATVGGRCPHHPMVERNAAPEWRTRASHATVGGRRATVGRYGLQPPIVGAMCVPEWDSSRGGPTVGGTRHHAGALVAATVGVSAPSPHSGAVLTAAPMWRDMAASERWRCTQRRPTEGCQRPPQWAHFYGAPTVERWAWRPQCGGARAAQSNGRVADCAPWWGACENNGLGVASAIFRLKMLQHAYTIHKRQPARAYQGATHVSDQDTTHKPLTENP